MLSKEETFERSEGSALIRGSDVYTSFCSSDFLGFSSDKRVFQAMRDGLSLENEIYSGLVHGGGGRPAHLRLSERISAFRASGSAKVFSSLLELFQIFFSNLRKEKYSLVASRFISAPIFDFLLSLIHI